MCQEYNKTTFEKQNVSKEWLTSFLFPLITRSEVNSYIISTETRFNSTHLVLNENLIHCSGSWFSFSQEIHSLLEGLSVLFDVIGKTWSSAKNTRSTCKARTWRRKSFLLLASKTSKRSWKSAGETVNLSVNPRKPFMQLKLQPPLASEPALITAQVIKIFHFLFSVSKF